MGGGGAFDGQTRAGGHRPLAIEWLTKWVDDAPQQFIAHGHIHDPAGALDFISRVEMPVFAEQNDANFLRVHVERNAQHIAGKRHQFIIAHAGEPRHLGDAGGDTGDRAHLPWPQLHRECFSHLAYSSKHPVENGLQALRFHVHWLFISGLGSSGLGSALASGLSFSFSRSSTPFSSDAR